MTISKERSFQQIHRGLGFNQARLFAEKLENVIPRPRDMYPRYLAIQKKPKCSLNNRNLLNDVHAGVIEIIGGLLPPNPMPMGMADCLDGLEPRDAALTTKLTLHITGFASSARGFMRLGFRVLGCRRLQFTTFRHPNKVDQT